MSLNYHSFSGLVLVWIIKANGNY